MNLFLQPANVGIEKKAGTPTKLSEDDSRWPQEITSEVYKAFPFLTDTDVQVELTRTEPASGVGVGRVVIRRSPPREDMRIDPGPVVILPIVIRGGEMEPLDIATTGGNHFPATKKRIESILSNPVLTSIGPPPSELPDATSYFTDLIPPSRNYHGAYPGLGSVKVGSAPILPQALTKVARAELEELCKEVASDPHTYLELQLAVPDMLHKISTAQPFTPTPLNIWAQVPPTVVQFEKLGSHIYRVSWANRNAFKKMAEEVPAQMAQQVMPPEAQQQMEQQPQQDPNMMAAQQQQQPSAMPEQMPQAQMPQEQMAPEATMSTEAPVNIPTLPTHDPTNPIVDAGEYLVFDAQGKSYSGWGSGEVLNFDESPAGMTVFSNGAVSAMQPAIAGAKTGTGFLPPTTRIPQGTGCFIIRVDGKLQVYSPVSVMSSFTTPDGRMGFVCQGMSGEQIAIQAIPEVRRATMMGEGMVAIPERYEFLPMDTMIPLLQPGQIMKQAAANIYSSPLMIICPSRNTYNLEGVPVMDLPPKERMGITKNAAKFLLVTCGVHPKQAQIKLAEAEKLYGDVVAIPGLRKISLGDPLYKQAMQKAAELQEATNKVKAPLLVKEAASIARSFRTLRNDYSKFSKVASMLWKVAFDDKLPEYETIDAILSLGLVNKDSISLFARQKDKLEDALSTLCSMLLFSRLGAPGIPEISLERCISSFDEILDSLGNLPYTVTR